MKNSIEIKDLKKCFGCYACAQSCPVGAITMKRDDLGFVYPSVDGKSCLNCGKCISACQIDKQINFNAVKSSWGGYSTKKDYCLKSTSGGLFSSFVDAFCEDNYAIIAAEEKTPTVVRHECIENKELVYRFRKSKYLQSEINDSYIKTKSLLDKNTKVLFCGTPCQIAGLKQFLNNKYYENLLTIDFACHGLPSKVFLEKQLSYFEEKYKAKVTNVDFRDKKSNKWDSYSKTFYFDDGEKMSLNRFFDPFFIFWLNNFMSRESCYMCPFTRIERVSDVTLMDFWGAKSYDERLYNGNKGTSAILINSEKGDNVFEKIKDVVLDAVDVNYLVKNNKPLREHSQKNIKYEQFINDLKQFDYMYLKKKYFKPDFITYLKKKMPNKIVNLLNRGRKK